MTKSTITREQLLEIIENDHVQCGEASYLARMVLAAMASESECLPIDYLQGHKDGLEWAAQLAEANHPETGDWLYDDPIELAKAIRKGPDMPPAQPAPVGPDDVSIFEAAIEECKTCDSIDEHAWNHGVLAVIAKYESCRAAMLQASPVCSCPSGNGSLRWPCPVHPGNSPAQSDCRPAQNHVSPEQNSVAPAQGGNSLVIPDEMTPEEAHEIGYYYGDPVNVFARGANWMRQHIIDSTLAAATQSPGSEPATVPGKWIPVSERMPEDEQEVLTINKMGHRFVSFFDKHSGLFFDRLDAPAACCIEHVLVTHWMPLPAAPQEVKGE